jgi:hypothetical protein
MAEVEQSNACCCIDATRITLDAMVDVRPREVKDWRPITVVREPLLQAEILFFVAERALLGSNAKSMDFLRE